jgi:hypothetical protein
MSLKGRVRDMDALERARQDTGLSIGELWLRYFAVGGMNLPLEMEAILYEALVGSRAERDLLAVALNDRFTELGGDHPVAYSDD